MPGRVSIRSARNSAVSRKSSTQTLKPRTSSARTSAYAVEIPDEGPLTSLRTQICSIFVDAQRNSATQRKSVISLRKIQEACCYEPVNPKKKNSHEEFGETEFNEEVGRCVIRILPVKKSESVGDRLIKFLGLFLKVASERDNAIAQPPDAEEEMDVFPETPTSRLTSHIISLILPMLAAKDKIVRFRATQIIAHIINTLDSIDDELFQLIRVGLLKRIRDRETAVRVQAVLGLGRLADDGEEGPDDEDSDNDSAGGILVKLLDVLQNDPSAEVRRSLLLNLPFTPSTLPYLLERARDLDAATRRALYARLLPALGDFRHLSLTHREKLLRWGLRDRDENVRKATARLFRERWIEDCASSHLPEDANPPPVGQVSSPSYEALLELLERIDIVNSGIEGGIAFEAMKEFWDGRPDYRDYITFEESFWKELTPEGAFIARTFNEYCREADDSKLQQMVEDKMPEVTGFAFYLKHHLNILIEGVQKVALQDDADAEEDTVQQEFCVEQLLHIAMTLDYSDEVGRRTVFSIMREALSLAELPEECTRLVVEVLRTVCGNNVAGEREFCGIVLEAVAEVHDTIMGEEAPQPEREDDDESFHSARSELSEESAAAGGKKRIKSEDPEDSQVDEEKAIREIMVNMKCLHIAQCMLQNVECDLEENSHLVTMLNNLVVPAVRSQEAPIRERGLTCLGLCCLLSKNLASENLTLFLHCFARGHEALQQISLQIITDILITHPTLLLPVPTEDNPGEPNPLLKPLTKAFLRAISSIDPSSGLPTTATTAASKLLLLNLLPANSAQDILKTMTLSFFTPDTAANPALRQALSYFLPVYCHSRLGNALSMAQVAAGIISKLLAVREELEEEEAEAEMVGWTVIAAMLSEWTDARRVVGAEETGLEGGQQQSEDILDPHAVLAGEIMERISVSGCTKEERKPLIALLSKLHFSAPRGAENPTITLLHELNTQASDLLASSKIASDATSRNVISKVQTTLVKIIGEQDEQGEPELEHEQERQETEEQNEETALPSVESRSKSQSQEPEPKPEPEPEPPTPHRKSRGKGKSTSTGTTRTSKGEESDGAVSSSNDVEMTDFTAMPAPDAEGTRYGDLELGAEPTQEELDSVMESLLNSDDDEDLLD